MDAAEIATRSLAWFHILLFVIWLGGDIGVFWLGQNFRRRASYTLAERVALLKMLVAIDMAPRTAWALMVPSSISLLKASGWWDVPLWGVVASWIVGLIWLLLVWNAHLHEGTKLARDARRYENVLKWGLSAFYLWLGTTSLLHGAPLPAIWLAWKALLFGVIFLVAIMIDVRFKPVGPLLVALLDKGSNNATEVPLRRAMDRTRRWVLTIYALLIVTSWLGTVKPI